MAALFGGEMAHGQRLWEVPGVEVEPRALVEHFERLVELDAQMPFFDFVISRSDAGERRAHRVTGKPRYDAAGRFLGYRGVGQDITEKRRAERALAEAKERLRARHRGRQPRGLGHRPRHRPTSTWATAGREMLRRAPRGEHARSSRCSTLVHPDDRARVRTAFLRDAEGRRGAARRGVPRAHRGGRLEVAAARGQGHASAMPTGRALRMTGTIVDIDARKRAEQAMREAEERYRVAGRARARRRDRVSRRRHRVRQPGRGAHAARRTRRSALLGMHVEELVHPGQRERFRERVGVPRGGSRQRPRSRSARCAASTAATWWSRPRACPTSERGRLVVQSVLRDVTEQRKAREVLAEREQRFRDVLEASGEYVWETDAEWRYTFLSERVEAVLGYLRHEMIGRTPREFMPLGEARAMDDWFARNATPGRGRSATSCTARSPSRAASIWQSVSGVPVLDAAGRLAGYRGTGADITARKQAEERIQYLATRDALTGLPNRVLLADRAGQAILAAARSARQPGGAAASTSTASSWSTTRSATPPATRCCARSPSGCGATLRRDDTLARLGGDEFVLLWNGLKSVAGRGDAGAARAGDPRAPVHGRGPHAQRRPPRSASASTRATGATSASC